MLNRIGKVFRKIYYGIRMNVLTYKEGTKAPEKNNLETIASQTHGRIIAIIKQGNGKSIEDQSKAIKLILVEVFQDAEEAEQLLLLKDAYIEDLTKTNEELLKRVKQIAADHNLLKNEYGLLQNKYSHLENRTEQLQKDLSVLHGKNLSAETQCSDLKLKTDALLSESQDLQLKYETLETQFDTLSLENESLKSRSTTVEDEGAKLATDFQQLQEENQLFKKESESLTQKFSTLETQYADLKDETDAWSTRYEDLNKDYAKLQKVVAAALKGQVKPQGIKPLKDPSDIITERFAACSNVLTFVGVQIWCAMPLPLQLIVQYGKEYYDKH